MSSSEGSRRRETGTGPLFDSALSGGQASEVLVALDVSG